MTGASPVFAAHSLLERRMLKLKAKFESSSSQFSLSAETMGAFDTGFDTVKERGERGERGGRREDQEEGGEERGEERGERREKRGERGERGEERGEMRERVKQV